MKKFSDFNIEVIQEAFTGDKLNISRVLNLPIIVLKYKVNDSKFSGSLLTLQIRKGESEHIVFTGSTTLIEMIERVPKEEFPFQTTIIKKDERFMFT